MADTGNDRVQVFAPTLTAAEYDSKLAVASPAGLAIDQSTGDVYVSTATGIEKYTADLEPAAGWTDPEVTGPLAVDPSTGDLLVADTGANLIRRFEADGTPAGTFAAQRPIDLAANSAGEILVVTTTGDIYGSCGPTSALARFADDGEELETIGGLTVPGAVAVDPDDDSILVTTFVNEYRCEQGNVPRINFLNPDGSPREVVSLPAGTMYAAVPALTARGDGSSRVYAITKSPANDLWGETRAFALQEPVPPVVTLTGHENVTAFTATVKGTVNPVGEAVTSCRFEYSTDESFDKSAPCSPNPGAVNEPVAVQANLTGLKNNTTYKYRLVAAKGALTATSSVGTFTTEDAELPEVKLLEPTLKNGVDPTYRAEINPRGNEATYVMQFRPAGEGAWENVSTIPGGSVPAGVTPVEVTKEGKTLQPNRSYEIRIQVTNGAGTVTDIRAFDTVAAPPGVFTVSASSIHATTATVNATIRPRNLETTYQFEWGPTPSYGNAVPVEPQVVGDDMKTYVVSADLSGLSAGQTYYFRITAKSASGTTVKTGSFQTRTEECSNAAIRGAQGAAFLDDCRAYEQVSPVKKFGYGLGSNLGWPYVMLVPSPDGERANYYSFNPVDGATATPSSGRTVTSSPERRPPARSTNTTPWPISSA